VKKERLDLLLVERGYYPSREKARKAIMAGEVLVNEIHVYKPGTFVQEDAAIRITGYSLPYVSRGGLKLEKAINTFEIYMPGKIVLDIGASTGGFTDCALKYGAARVYAVDVGYGQLAWSLRQDPRVVVMERTNARYLDPSVLREKIDIATIDVSFISITKILPAICRCLHYEGEIIALVKPQFEAGPERVGKKGVVREAHIHCDILKEIKTEIDNMGLKVYGLTYSPVRGSEGNIEFLLWLGFKGKNIHKKDWEELVDKVVKDAHENVS